MMFRILSIAMSLMLATVAGAAEYSGRLSADAPLNNAPAESPTGVVVAAGTEVHATVCFDSGTWCMIDHDGRIGFIAGALIELPNGTTAAAAEVAAWQTLTGGSPTTVLPPASRFVAWGDELSSYVAVANELLAPGRQVIDETIDGQTTTSVVARLNAVDTLLTLKDNKVPGEGFGIVIQRSALPLTSNERTSLTGTLCGVHGVLTAVVNDDRVDYAFIRDAPATDSHCLPRNQMLFDAGVEYRDDVAWFWLGRNGADEGRTVLGDISSAVATLGHNRFLVASLLAWPGDTAERIAEIARINERLAALYGERYLDVAQALADAGNGSGGDNADTAAGITPRSLRTEGGALNDIGNRIAAEAFIKASDHFGW